MKEKLQECKQFNSGRQSVKARSSYANKTTSRMSNSSIRDEKRSAEEIIPGTVSQRTVISHNKVSINMVMTRLA